jgi:hypothetical protein
VRLTGDELTALVRRVFAPRADDSAIGILIDLPDATALDTSSWRARRRMAADWVTDLATQEAALGLRTDLLLFQNTHTNNGDLPAAGAVVYRGGPVPDSYDDLANATFLPWPLIFERYSILLAPTRFSATAPLKVAARRAPIRAATMPGFSEAMIPALRLDYVEVNRRVGILAAHLTRASGATMTFRAGGEVLTLHLDLRFREAHASGGLLHTPGTAGNLPSGEAYIVPYEGERPGEPSRTQGQLPVQFGDEIVIYEIEENRAVRVRPGGAQADAEAARLSREPAYGNLAELGLGVLAAFGVEPVGEVLLDEKLGPHIAFGRSDHFGGRVGPDAFSAPDAVVHIDRVYVPGCQPGVHIDQLELHNDDGSSCVVMTDDAFVVDLFQPSR